MNSLESFTAFFVWCTVLNYGLLIFMSLIVTDHAWNHDQRAFPIIRCERGRPPALLLSGFGSLPVADPGIQSRTLRSLEADGLEFRSELSARLTHIEQIPEFNYRKG